MMYSIAVFAAAGILCAASAQQRALDDFGAQCGEEATSGAAGCLAPSSASGVIHEHLDLADSTRLLQVRKAGASSKPLVAPRDEFGLSLANASTSHRRRSHRRRSRRRLSASTTRRRNLVFYETVSIEKAGMNVASHSQLLLCNRGGFSKALQQQFRNMLPGAKLAYTPRQAEDSIGPKCTRFAYGGTRRRDTRRRKACSGLMTNETAYFDQDEELGVPSPGSRFTKWYWGSTKKSPTDLEKAVCGCGGEFAGARYSLYTHNCNWAASTLSKCFLKLSGERPSTAGWEGFGTWGSSPGFKKHWYSKASCDC